MTLIVEDGAAKSDAETYASVAQADVYCSARSITAWAALTTAKKEVALRQAGDHMLQNYRSRWMGVRYTITQAQDWPRVGVSRADGSGSYRGLVNYYATSEVPAEVVRACIELAIRASTAPLIKDLGAQIDSVSVDVVTVTYAAGAREQARYEAVDRLLAPFLTSTAYGFAVSRA